EGGAADLDLELGQIAPLEQVAQPVDEAEQRGVAGVDRHDRCRRRLGDRGVRGVRGLEREAGDLVDLGPVAGRLAQVVGHASHRRKIRAVFWPPNPNEFESATRTSWTFARFVTM